MVNVFKILWPKYMLYFLYFNNKIQNTIQAVMEYHYWPGQCNVTMSHEVQSMLLHKTLFSSGYCSVRRKIASRIFIRQLPTVTRTNKASDISLPLMNALYQLFEEYCEKLF